MRLFNMSNILALSDDELMQLDEQQFVESEQDTDTQEQEVVESSDDVVEPVEQVDDADDVSEESSAHDDTQTDDTAEETQEQEQTEQPQEQKDIDYKAFYEHLTAPFKANGREIRVDNPQDAISLMQMGANYSQKMAGIKPHKTILKTLEANGLLDNDKLNYLIDLHNKNPEAIAKLIKESDLDVYSLDADKADEYKPNNNIEPYSPIEEVIEELASEKFNTVLNTVANWDENSRSIIIERPDILRALNEQANNGLFDEITQEVERQRMFGRLTGVPYIEAYSMVESQLLNTQATNGNAVDMQHAFTAPRPNHKSNNTSNSNKVKATSPKSVSKPTKPDFNPLAVSDEDFMRFMEQQQYH